MLIIGIVFLWILIGFFSSWLFAKLDFADLYFGGFVAIIIFSPVVFVVLLCVYAFKGLYFIYDYLLG